MNLTNDVDFVPALILLPFGGFEVAVLLAKIETADRVQTISEDTSNLIEVNGETCSGWLHSKLMGG